MYSVCICKRTRQKQMLVIYAIDIQSEQNDVINLEGVGAKINHMICKGSPVNGMFMSLVYV